MKKIKKFNYVLLLILLAVLLLAFPLFWGGGMFTAYAATTEYSNVLDDLRKDAKFDFNEFPAVENDYSLQVVQIAESANGELFLYVYQPAAAQINLTASSVNISTAINDNLKYKNYTLTLLNSAGVFSKYLVNDLTLKIDTVRYYDISSIFRLFNSQIDDPASGGNVVNEVVYEVGQLWTACTLNDSVTYEVVTSEVIVVTDKYVGFVRYPDGHDFWGSTFSSCDSHYIAFSTNKEIDKLLQADVYFISQSSDKYIGVGTGTGGRVTLGDKVEKYITLNYTDVVSNSGDKFGGKKYTWNRIERVSDFIDKEDLQTDAISDLNGKQWVLRFYESAIDYQYSGSPASGNFSSHTYSTNVTDVTILRLKFETAGEVYNLGVVDNKQTGDGNADNKMSAVSFLEILFQFFGRIGSWLAGLLHIPAWAGKVVLAVIILIVVLFVISIIVNLIRKIKGD